jgi:hypothetical protein
MINKVKLNITGHLVVKAQVKDGPWETMYDEHNAIHPNHLNIIRKALAGQPGAKLSNIRAMAGGNTLALALITQDVTPISPSNVVELIAEFNEQSFNGTLDELRLEALSDGIFSYVDNLLITKDNTTKLGITWKLTINSL